MTEWYTDASAVRLLECAVVNVGAQRLQRILLTECDNIGSRSGELWPYTDGLVKRNASCAHGHWRIMSWSGSGVEKFHTTGG